MSTVWPVPGVQVVTGTVDEALGAGLGDLNAFALVQALAARAGVDLTQG